MNRKLMTKAEVIARATVYQDGDMVRGKIPVPVVKALKAKAGDELTFAARADGSIVMRKTTAAERQATTGKRRSIDQRRNKR